MSASGTAAAGQLEHMMRQVTPGRYESYESLLHALAEGSLWMLLWQGQLLASLKTRHPGRHATRGAIGISSMAFGFSALGFLPLPEAMMIGYAAPLMVVALSAIILCETVRVYRWTATAIGFVGIIIILWPRLTFFEGAGFERAALIGSVLALIGALSSAFAAITIR